MPLAGNIWKVIATRRPERTEGDVLLILEAMKMETETAAQAAPSAYRGEVRGRCSVGDTLMTLA